MPPRHAYWTIIVEGKPTAFRAHDRDDLLPTLRQLQARHPDTVMMWFARGRLWGSPEEAQTAGRGGTERRASDWRPGGEHRDPRARFAISRDEKRRRFAARQRRDHRQARPEGTDRPDRRERPPGHRPHRSGDRFAPRGPKPRPGDSPQKPAAGPARPRADRRPDADGRAWGGRGDTGNRRDSRAGDRRDSRAGGSGPHKGDRPSRGPQGGRDQRGGWRQGGGSREGTSGRTRTPGEQRDRPPHRGGDRSKPAGQPRGKPGGRKPGGGRGGRGGGGTGR